MCSQSREAPDLFSPLPPFNMHAQTSWAEGQRRRRAVNLITLWLCEISRGEWENQSSPLEMRKLYSKCPQPWKIGWGKIKGTCSDRSNSLGLVPPFFRVSGWVWLMRLMLRSWGEQLRLSLENEGDPHSELWDPCRQEWVETQSFIFKDGCNWGVGVKSMRRLYLDSSLLFVLAEKKAL